MTDVRLAVRQVRSSKRWVAVLQVPLPNGDERAATVGTYPTWGEALTEGCVAGRLQAAGVSWGMPAPDVAPPETPHPAVNLEELPVDAVGRSLPSTVVHTPTAMTYGSWRDEQREGWGHP